MEAYKPEYNKETILVVDDDRKVLIVLEELLRSLGFSAASAASGEEALKALNAQPYSFVLVDMKMPQVDGFVLIKETRKSSPETSVIAMTAYSDDYKYIDIVRAGAADFIKKPVDVEELEAKIVRVVRERDLRKELSRLSITDSLTNVFNRRHFFRRLREEMVRASRQKHPLSLMLLDLDNFKEYNDTQGHLAGDEILRNVGRMITKSIREGVDSVYRYGGDEFAVILIDAELSIAQEIGRRIQQSFKESGKITASIGYMKYLESMNVTDLVSGADRALYEAKTFKRKDPV